MKLFTTSSDNNEVARSRTVEMSDYNIIGMFPYMTIYYKLAICNFYANQANLKL